MAAVNRISAGFGAALRSEALLRRLAKPGSEPAPNTPEDFAGFIRAEIPRWAEIVRLSSATAD